MATSALTEKSLAGSPFLARLSSEDRKALAGRARARSFKAGATIFSEGEPGDALYVVVEGHVRIVISSDTGDETTVAVLGPGQVVGDQALLDGGQRSATAVAAIATKTLVVTREMFTEWLMEHPAAAIAIMETLSQRLRRMNQQMLDMVSLDLTHRLAKQLISLASVYDIALQPGNAPVRLQITQSDLASMLGVSRESVNKQINAFSRQGYVTLSRGAITIQDMAALQAFE
jgi:CRP/FNR family transcriptional regulator, cyclic AMP receptor protein